MVTKIVKPNSTVCLGRQGENRARRMVWPNIVAEYAGFYGDGTFTLAAQRKGDAAPYPVAITVEDGSVVWVVSDSDTAIPGCGKCELTYFVGGTVAKSQTWTTLTLSSITAQELSDPPEAQKSWVDQVLQAGALAIADATSAQADAQSASESATAAAASAKSAEEAAEYIAGATSAEEWTFELEDGTSVTKQVVLKNA